MKKNMINQLDELGNFHGPWEHICRGRLTSRGKYKNGYRQGIWEFYDSYGHIRLRGEFKNGNKYGLCYSVQYDKSKTDG